MHFAALIGQHLMREGKMQNEFSSCAIKDFSVSSIAYSILLAMLKSQAFDSNSHAAWHSTTGLEGGAHAEKCRLLKKLMLRSIKSHDSHMNIFLCTIREINFSMSNATHATQHCDVLTRETNNY